MSPDFEYLLRLRPYGSFGHTLSGVALFCLPAGLVVWGAFRALVKPAALSLLPSAWATDLRETDGHPILGAGFAIVLGAFTHIAWDACTHAYGWVVGQSAFLRTELTGGPATIPIYRLLQHGSTIVGLLVVAAWVRGWFVTQPASAEFFTSREAARTYRVVSAVMLMAVLALLLNSARAWGAKLAVLLGYAAVGAMDGLALGLFGFGIAFAWSKRTT